MYKLIGVLISITETKPKKICINLTLPCSDMMNSMNSINKLLKLDENMTKKMSKMYISDNIEKIKIYKPIYYKYFRNKESNKTTRDLIIKLNISNSFCISSELLGSVVEIKAKANIYNFNNSKDKSQKIRGWKLNVINIKKIKEFSMLEN